MKYIDITKPEELKRMQRRQMRRTHLYTSIFRDAEAILIILLPNDKAFKVAEHVKSIIYALIELKTGHKAEKF